jgi:hypothetical protein
MFPDSFHDNLADALDEVAKRRADPQGKGLITRVEPSGYGGLRVRSLPAEFYIDLLADGPIPISGNATRRHWAEL